MVTIEPSCYSALTDDLLDLIDDDSKIELFKKQICPIEIFLVEEIENGNINGSFKIKQNAKHILHGHCHQKASYGTNDMHKLMSLCKADYMELNSGCCGMAGSFGYEINHFDVSKKIFDLSFSDKLNQDEIAIANGFSCRHQIEDFTKIKAKHRVECIEFVDHTL
jgi:Fe-S oxidoreductase